MAKDPIEEIRLLESKARGYHLGKRPAKAVGSYESAGDKSIVEARKYGDSKENRRKVSSLLLRAKNNYESAQELMKKEDQVEIKGKISSVQNKIEDLESGGLEKKFIFPILAIATLVAALFFVSFNLTGYAIGGLTQNNSTLLGISLFILGMIFAFFYFRNKK